MRHPPIQRAIGAVTRAAGKPLMVWVRTSEKRIMRQGPLMVRGIVDVRNIGCKRLAGADMTKHIIGRRHL